MVNLVLSSLKLTDALSLKQMNGEEHVIYFKIFSVLFIRLGWA